MKTIDYDKIDFVEVNRLLGLMEGSVNRISQLCAKIRVGFVDEIDLGIL